MVSKQRKRFLPRSSYLQCLAGPQKTLADPQMLLLPPRCVGSPSGSLCHSIKTSFVALASFLWNVCAWCLLWAVGQVFWGATFSPKPLLAAEPRQAICLGSPVTRRELCGFPWRSFYHRSKGAAAFPPSGNPLLLGGKMSLLQHVPDCWVSQSWPALVLEACSPASPASCPVSLCVWPWLREASLMGWQLLCVMLGQTLSDSTSDVGHCSPKTHPRNVGQG